VCVCVCVCARVHVHVRVDTKYTMYTPMYIARQST